MALLVAILCSAVFAPESQPQGVLRVRVALVDADGRQTPVPDHALLISDNPASAPPRRIRTKIDGTLELSLRAGSYTVESDKPVALNGKIYQWVQMVDVTAGSTAVLELSADNADVETAAGDAATATSDPSFLLPRWQESVVALWTPRARASGFILDTGGLIATSQKILGPETAVAVQLAPDLKVPARVVLANADRDVVILSVHPSVVSSRQPVPLTCGAGAKPPARGDEIFAISAPLGQSKDMTSGTVSSVAAHIVWSDLTVAPGGVGGPVFAKDGAFVGLTSVLDEKEEGIGDVRVARADDVCAVLADAKGKLAGSPPPDPTRLPTEPTTPFPQSGLRDAAANRSTPLRPYAMTSSGFEIAFITPVMTFAARNQPVRTSGGGAPETGGLDMLRLTEFGAWSTYLRDDPAVVLVRITPRLTEGFWTKVARGAARTQGIAIPPIKAFGPGFARMRAFCGETEIAPIHPFRLDLRVTDKDVLREGLYAFHPDAFGPHCSSVRLELYSEKDPQKADAVVVDPAILERTRADFAPYRSTQR